jgi:hypothetical protein
VVWKVGGAVLGQTALLTGLLVYFGWQRSQTTYGYFGLDVRLVGLSPTDLVLASVGSAYEPLLLVGLVFLAGTLLHSARAGGWLRSPKNRSRTAIVGWALVGVGVVATLSNWFANRVGAIVPDNPGLAFAWLPVTLAAGFALLAYVSTTGTSTGTQATFALVALAVMALFWTVSLLAVRDGRERARYIESHGAALSEVAVLAHDDLLLDGPGVIHTDLRPMKRKPRVCQSLFCHHFAGLRLLSHGNGKYFLLPLGWRRGIDRVYMVPDERDVRVEIIAH